MAPEGSVTVMRWAGVALFPVITWLAVMISPLALYMTPVPTNWVVPVCDGEETAVTPTMLGPSSRVTKARSPAVSCVTEVPESGTAEEADRESEQPASKEAMTNPRRITAQPGKRPAKDRLWRTLPHSKAGGSPLGPMAPFTGRLLTNSSTLARE